jgi:hypothetical protein
MASVLTAKAKITCIHQGTVQLIASQQKLKAGGSPVLVMGDLEGKPISGCTLASTGATPCTAVTSTISGASAKLRVGEKPVLLDTARGATNAGTWQVLSAGQSKLQAS